ncbi:hypothetical protein ACFV9W_31420 [Streptomyces sp. NPDC059897]|uniref:hypothetical protein n=1 Tax=Streptomyces sp. NPDC059897 TaxID=3346994 RepID=UPI00366708BA
MANVSFSPTFRHTDWVDHRDRVQAGSPNGFNARFRALEKDLTTLSTVVADVDTALDELGAGPAPTQHTLSLSPALAPGMDGGAWVHDASGHAARTGGLTRLAGVQSVSVPHGARLVSLRALGQNASVAGRIQITLLRCRLLSVGSVAERIAGILGDTDPFDRTESADASFSLVDTTAFRYFIYALLKDSGAGDTVTLSGFQIVYTL